MNSQTPRSVFSRTWSGFWSFVDGARRVITNLIFLVVLIVVIRLLTANDQSVTVESGTTLVIRPSGAVVEQYSGYPLDRAIAQLTGDETQETQLRSILAALKKAHEDPHITQVLLDTSRLQLIGSANLQELAAALEHFRTSGKRVIAMDSFYTEDRYFLASLADEVWLDPQGLIWFDGFSYFRNFYREALDHLAVDVHLFRVGTYKSALEPFILDSMSEADRQAGQYLIDDLWNSYISAIALHRGLPVEVLNQFTQEYPERVITARGDSAKLALDAGLVDRLMSWPEARAELALNGATDQETGFRQVAMLDYLTIEPARVVQPQDRIGVIVAEGTIVQGEQPPGVAGALTLAKLIRKAAQDDTTKAVVLRINSPGGDALASEIIRREAELLAEAGKPLIVSMGNVAASGGYWIAMGADEVWANTTTITGSIGIYGVFPTLNRTLDKLGIHTDGIGTTPLSGAIRPDRPLADSAGAMLQAMIENGYRDFIELVAEHREMSPDAVNRVAQGRVWSGDQALDRSLVDQLGTLQDAIAAAAKRAGLGEDYQVHYVEETLSSTERWLTTLTANAMVKFDLDMPRRSPLSHRLAGLDALGYQWSQTPQAQRVLDELKLITDTRQHPQVLAHCLCAPP